MELRDTLWPIAPQFSQAPLRYLTAFLVLRKPRSYHSRLNSVSKRCVRWYSPTHHDTVFSLTLDEHYKQPLKSDRYKQWAEISLLYVPFFCSWRWWLRDGTPMSKYHGACEIYCGIWGLISFPVVNKNKCKPKNTLHIMYDFIIVQERQPRSCWLTVNL